MVAKVHTLNNNINTVRITNFTSMQSIEHVLLSRVVAIAGASFLPNRFEHK